MTLIEEEIVIFTIKDEKNIIVISLIGTKLIEIKEIKLGCAQTRYKDKRRKEMKRNLWQAEPMVW